MVSWFSDSIAAALPELQAHAESLMVDTCRVDRRAGNDAWVIVDGIEQPVPPVPVYEGKCKVTSYQPYESTPDVGAATVTTQRYSVHLPVSAGRFVVGDVVTITGSADVPNDVGRVLRIAGAHTKTWQTAQRLLTDEISG